ncbi:hypothetical protein MMC30_007255 [Trapelia coarctata]|nr:hypothetical protein [Trapelia coarctata]
MSTLITERAILPLAPGADIEDPSSLAGIVFKNLLTVVAAQPGFLGGYWGHRIGTPGDAEHICMCGWRQADWESLEAHENFNDTKVIEPLLKDLMTIIHADPPFYHVYYSSLREGRSEKGESLAGASSFLACSPPVTELTTMHLLPSCSVREASALVEAWDEFALETLKKVDGFICTARGWLLEELGCAEVGVGKTKGFQIAIG